MSALANELTTDPLGVGYSSMTDQQAADQLAALSRPGPIPSRELLVWSAKTGAYAKIQDATANVALGQQVRSAAMAAVRMVAREDTQLDTQDTTVMTLIDALVSAGVLDPTDKSSLIAMAANRVSRLQELGIVGPVYAVDVSAART